MNAATVFQVLSFVSDRVARAQSGTAFTDPKAVTCAHPERMAHVASRLHWISPLEVLTKEEQEFLGLRAARPGGVEEDEPLELEEVHPASPLENREEREQTLHG